MNPSVTSFPPSVGNVFEIGITFGVEICLGGDYVGICDVGWDDRAARVACNQLGYTDGEL